MTDKRPRIPPDLAARIDKARKAGTRWEVPFEKFCRDALELFVDLDDKDRWLGMFSEIQMRVRPEPMLSQILFEAYGWQWEPFQEAVDKLREEWIAEMAAQADDIHNEGEE